MTANDAVNLIQSGGALGAVILFVWMLLTGKVVTRREFDALQSRYNTIDELNKVANDELRRQSATNARLVEGLMLQRQEAEDIRREPQKRRATDG